MVKLGTEIAAIEVDDVNETCCIVRQEILIHK